MTSVVMLLWAGLSTQTLICAIENRLPASVFAENVWNARWLLYVVAGITVGVWTVLLYRNRLQAWLGKLRWRGKAQLPTF